MSDQPPWDPYGQQDPSQQVPPRYRPQAPYGQQPYRPGQPQDGQDWGPYQGQPPYPPYGQEPPQPSLTPNPRYWAPGGQQPYQGQPYGFPAQQPYAQAAPQWSDPDLHRQRPDDQFRQQEAGSGPPPHRRKRSRAPMYAVVAGLVVIAGAGAAYALVSHGTGSSSAALVSNGTGSPSAAKPLTCQQQYSAWKTGPALAQAKQLIADFNKVTAAAKVEDITALTSALEAAGPDAAALEQYPMPACADPGGYWGQMLARIKAAGDNAGTASGLGAILLAEAPLQQVPGIEQKLSAELKRSGITGGLPR